MPQDRTGPGLGSLLDAALQVAGLSAGAVYCLDGLGRRLRLTAHRHLPASFAPPTLDCLPADPDSPPALRDLWDDPDQGPQAEAAGLRTRLDLPLRARGETVGVMRLFGARPDPVAPNHLELLESLGQHMALTILNARELELNRSHRERLARLYALSAEIASVISLGSALDLTVRHVVSATGAHSAIINVLDQDGHFVHRFGVDREGRELVDEPLPRKAGFTRTIQSTGRLVAVTGLRQEAEEVPGPERERGVRAFVGLPLRSGALVFGALFVRFDYPREFPPEEIRALELYADQAAGAITRLRLLEETRRRERELSNLLEVSRAISSTLELDEVLRRVATSMARALEMNDCAISSFDPDSCMLRTLADYSPDGQADPSTVGISFRLENYPATARALERDEPLIVRVTDEAADPAEVAYLQRVELGLVLMLPLHARGRPLGLAELYAKDAGRAITADDLKLARALAEQAAVAIDNATLHAAAQKAARRKETLFRLSRDLAGLLDEGAIRERATRGLAQMLGLPFLAIFLVEPESGDRVANTFYGLTDPPEAMRLSPGVGLSARAVIDGGLRYTPDIEKTPEYHPGLPGARSEVDVPIRVGGQVAGVLVAESPLVDGFTPDDRDTLQAAADLIELGLERARLYAAERRAHLAATSLREATGVLSSSLQLDRVLELVLQQLRRVVPYESASLMLLDGDRVRVVAGQGHPEPSAALQVSLSASEDALFSEVTRRRAPLIIDDAQSDPRFHGLGGTAYARGWMGVPLLVRDAVLGWLTLDSRRPGAYGPADAQLASAIAGQAALAIENARLYATTRRWLRDQTLLYESGQELAAAQDPVAALAAVAERWIDRLGGHALGYYVYDSDGGRLRKEYEFRGPRAAQCPPTTDDAKSAADCPRLLDILESRTPQVLRAGDEALTQAERSLLRERNARAMLVAPLVYANRPQGFLAVWHDASDLGDVERQLVRSFAGAAAVAIEKASLFRAELERTDELVRSNTLIATLGLVAARLRVAPDPNAVLQTLGAELKRVGMNCWVASLSASDEALETRFISLNPKVMAEAERLTGLKAPGFRIASDRFPRYRELIERRRPLYEKDALAVSLGILPRFMWPVVRQTLRVAGIRSDTPAISIPLVVEDRVLGVFTVWGEFLKETDVPSLSIFASQLAIAIENARLLEAERRRSVQLGLLFDVSRQVAGSLDETEILQRAVTAMVHRLGYVEAAAMLAVSEDELELVAAAETEDMGVTLGDRQRVGQGVVGHVAETRATHLANDIAADAYYFSPIGRTVGSALGLPLLREGHLLGVLYVESNQRGAFSPADVLALETLANHVVTAQENARLYAGARRRLSEITALQSVTQTVTSSLDLQGIFQTVVQLLQDTFGYRYVSIYQLDGDVLRLGAQVGYPPGRVFLEIPVSQGVSGRTVRTGRPQFVPDVARDGDFMAASPDVRREICVPLLKGPAVLGTLNVESASSQPLTERDVSLLASIAGPVAVAIDNAQLFRAEREQRELAEALREAGAALGATLKLDEVFDRLLDHVSRAVPYDVAHVSLIEAGRARVARERVCDPSSQSVHDHSSALDLEIAATPNLRQMIESGKPLVIPDVFELPGWRRLDSDPPIRSWAGAPIVARGRAIALFSLNKAEPGFYGPRHVAPLNAFAGQAALAIENARLYEESQRRTLELAGLYDTALATGNVLDAGTLLSRLSEQVHKLLAPDSIAVALYHEASDELELLLALESGEEVDGAVGLRVQLERGGLTGWVIRNRRPLLVGDMRTDPLPVAPRHITQPARAWLGVPLVARDRVIGAVSLQSFRAGAFDESSRRFLESLAGLVANALENARLYRAEREQRELAEALHAAGVALSSTLDLDEVLARLLEQVRRVVPYDSGSVMLVEGGHVRVAHVVGDYGPGDAAARAAGDLSFEIAATPNLRQMIESGKPLVIPDVFELPGWRRLDSDTPIRSWAGAPILAGGRLIGFFLLGQREPGLYRPEHAERLSAFAGQAALAIENALLYKETTRQATTDWLTGAYNRHHFQRQLPDELARARRLGYPIALLMVDLDHFKRLNDTRGHLQGDRALRQVAETLRGALRSHDSLYKYGGEEFAIILPGCGPHSLLDTAERLRQAVEGMHFEVDGVRWPISVSLGGTHLLDNGEWTEDLIARADAALYRAKSEGRNRVCLA